MSDTNAIVEQNKEAAAASPTALIEAIMPDEMKQAINTLKEKAFGDLKELLGNGLHIYGKAEHFTADEIDALARWIHQRMIDRAGA